jgi:hypothetical protein
MQYYSKAKARGTIAALVAINDICSLLEQIKNRLNINKLNSNFTILAKILGISDITSGISVTKKAFGYILYGQESWNVDGFINYATEASNSIFMTYRGQESYNYSLTSSEMQLVLKFRIARNNINTSLKEIDEFFVNYLPDIHVDETDIMTLKYYVPQAQADFFNILLNKNLLLKNSGQQIVFEYT